MEMFVIEGCQPLSGRVSISGAKNAALPIMASTLLSDGPNQLQGVPNLVDVVTLSQLLSSLGMKIERNKNDSLLLEVIDESCFIADYDLVRRMRASICVLGPLLAKRKKACVSLPGGCNIGDRPVNLHLKGLAALGADIRIEQGYIIAEAKQLTGAKIYLGGPFGSTVTGTCNVMSAATLAKGTTTIEAAACEPEVVDLGNYLNAMGAKITGLGTPFLEIQGVESLTGTDYKIIPDRIEAATLMMAAAITNSSIELENVNLAHMTAIVEKLQELGVNIRNSDDVVHVSSNGKLNTADCIALPYPGIPTDVQAQLMALLTITSGMNIVTDKVFPDRFMHAAELTRMGASIRREGPNAIIHGQGQLNGACVMASDLRASAALVLAGLAAKGATTIRRIYHLDRGYEKLDEKLNSLGAHIKRVKDSPENRPQEIQPDLISLSNIPDDAEKRSTIDPPKWLTKQERKTGRR